MTNTLKKEMKVWNFEKKKDIRQVGAWERKSLREIRQVNISSNVRGYTYGVKRIGKELR